MEQVAQDQPLPSPSPEEERRHHRLRCELAGLPPTPYRPPRRQHLLLRDRRFKLLGGASVVREPRKEAEP